MVLDVVADYAVLSDVRRSVESFNLSGEDATSSKRRELRCHTAAAAAHWKPGWRAKEGLALKGALRWSAQGNTAYSDNLLRTVWSTAKGAWPPSPASAGADKWRRHTRADLARREQPPVVCCGTPPCSSAYESWAPTYTKAESKGKKKHTISFRFRRENKRTFLQHLFLTRLYSTTLAFLCGHKRASVALYASPLLWFLPELHIAPLWVLVYFLYHSHIEDFFLKTTVSHLYAFFMGSDKGSLFAVRHGCHKTRNVVINNTRTQ